ncbi:hypothetical protein A6B35_31225 (plasmid) [Mesorhizobium amorphae CCNWGS0123]|nr:hypothetical protein A6B35_31225 [Mesorhizobium amorphae CCNWGS0123]
MQAAGAGRRLAARQRSGVAGVKKMTHDREALAGMRVMRILDNDFKRLLLGSMSRVRRER